MELAYDRVLRMAERETETFANPSYIQTLKSSHIFILNEDIVSIVNNYQGSLLRDSMFVKNEKVCMPFDNLWIDMPKSVITTEDTGKVYTADAGMHFVSLGIDNVYAFATYRHTYGVEAPGYLVPFHAAIIRFVLKDYEKHGDLKYFITPAVFNFKDVGMCKATKEFAFPYVTFTEDNKGDVGTIGAEDIDTGSLLASRFMDKMHYWVGGIKFCSLTRGKEGEGCGRACQEAKRALHAAVNHAIAAISFINLPINRILRVVSREQKEAEAKGKKVRGIFGDKRPHYIILDHEQARAIYEDSEEAKSDTAPRRGHERRAHRRHCMGRTQNGKWIPYAEHKQTQWVKQCWVGSREFTVGQQIYEVIG